ncbi:DUF1206 domain-containing protein [Sphingomonas sp. UV9]|uniref:DUF1206 domain-containing protein n=1 Tax=Sphingomonas sp. UV9 TaxID=1851410 RepID=UPI0013E8AEEC|nr:DUF1206 domain-containing protein [Sphingomonas sp. UV9]
MISDTNATLLAKLGFAARGVVYILVGWFAVDAALRGGEVADNQGAIGSMANESFGPVLLAIIAAGLLGYAVWRLTEAAANPERIGSDVKSSLKRIGHLVSGIAHVVLAWTAAKLAMNAGSRDGAVSPGDESARDWTALLLDQPAGRVLVGAVAIGILVAAFQQAQKAWRGNFIKDLRGDAPLPGYVCTVGRIGYGARALVFLIVAGLFGLAAWSAHASDAGGVADALQMLQAQPGGKWLLVLTGIGLALFGAYSLVEARFRRIHVDLPGTN